MPKDSKYPIRWNSGAAAELVLICVPQFDIQVLLKPLRMLPGPPFFGACTSQCCGNTPQKPQLLQHALRGHGLSSLRAVPEDGG